VIPASAFLDLRLSSPMRSLSVVGVWVFEFLASDRLSGSNPQKMRFCPGWRRTGSYIRRLVSVAFIRIAGPP
jgi:hypothetical protein